MLLFTEHTYESNVVRSAKRVAYFGQVETYICTSKTAYFICCGPIIAMSDH